MIKQTTTLDGETVTTIRLGRMAQKDGEKLAQKLSGQTYMDFRISVAPDGGEYVVTASSSYDDEADKIMEMLLFLMATELAEQ